MLARYLRIIVLLELAGAGWIAFALVSQGGGLAASVAIGLVVPLGVHGLIIALDFGLAAAAGSTTPASHRLGAVGAVGVFLREWRDSVIAFQFAQPWLAPHALPGEDAAWAGRAGCVPVLLIHGFFCNRQLWRPLAGWLAARGHVVAAVDLEPVLGSIDDYVPAIATAVERLLAKTGAPAVALVGHSMGGLVARAYLRRRGNEHVAALVTLGTPHRGTVHARFGHGANARQMRTDSTWLKQLSAHEAARGAWPITTVILSHHDNIVAPQADQTVPHATTTVALGGVGHLSLVYDRKVWALIAEALAGHA